MTMYRDCMTSLDEAGLLSVGLKSPQSKLSSKKSSKRNVDDNTLTTTSSKRRKRWRISSLFSIISYHIYCRWILEVWKIVINILVSLKKENSRFYFHLFIFSSLCIIKVTLSILKSLYSQVNRNIVLQKVIRNIALRKVIWNIVLQRVI